MTSQTPTPTPAASPAPATHQAGAREALEGFGAYAAAMEQGDTPILGYLLFYAVFDGRVTFDDLHRWFLELGLDSKFLPPPIRQVDAYEQVTGKAGVRSTYRLSDTATPRRRRAPGEKVTEVTLMVRHVSRDNLKVTRHLVREVRDEGRTRLSYNTKLAEIEFWRDPLGSGRPGVGVLQVTPAHDAIGELGADEQAKVQKMLADIEDTYQRQCRFYTSDRLRSVVRTYVEALNPVRVRASGGVYFVHRSQVGPLAALRELTQRFGAGSHLARVPLPDQKEMREMIIAAFTTKAREDLDKLALDIAAAQRENHSEAAVANLLKRFRALQDSTTEHSTLLSSSLEETRASLLLVQAQFSNLMNRAG
ncbi:DUF6744 family protein [Streptosporangium sp. NPDC002721]|uniref:DUF6744 family protein n=1 Tax=Streptosporangium sp. NPDC002721 TaxID=3366188 RepID=UPI00369B3323